MNELIRKIDGVTSMHSSGDRPNCGREGMKKVQTQTHRKAGIRLTGLFYREAIATWKPKVFMIHR